MQFTIEFSADAERDFELIFDHLFQSYLSFGERIAEALAHAGNRIDRIRRTASRLGTAPHRGTLYEDAARAVTIDRAIYWFEVHDAEEKVRVLAIFLAAKTMFGTCSRVY